LKIAIPISVESRQAWFQEHQPHYRPILVTEIEHQVIAWLSFQSFYSRPAYNATAEISIYVDPRYLGRGIGSKLLAYGIQYSYKLKIKTLLAFVFGHNQPSLRLFEKFGFQEWGYLPRIAELDNIERDLLILGKRINF
jgi:phosphinothricin acetyltransferase